MTHIHKKLEKQQTIGSFRLKTTETYTSKLTHSHFSVHR